jgi:hypothetical protein
LGLFSPSISLPFDFISSLLLPPFLDIISFSSDKKRKLLCFPVKYFLGIFGTDLIFRSLEEVVSSGELPERSIGFN